MNHPLQPNDALKKFVEMVLKKEPRSPRDYASVLLACANSEPLGHKGVDRFFSDARKWVSRLARYGVTKALVGDLNNHLAVMKTVARMQFHPTYGYLDWEVSIEDEITMDGIVSKDRVLGDLSLDDLLARAVAFYFAKALQEGGLDGVKRCGMSDCKKFFVGTYRAKWCSNTCGSRNRARNKRIRDRGAGSLESRYL